MSYPLIQLKRGDTAPPARAVLADETGGPLSLVGVSSVFFHMADDSGDVRANGAASVVNAAAGQVEYAWAPTDTEGTGRFFAEWEVVFSNGLRRTLPMRGFQRVHIRDDLA